MSWEYSENILVQNSAGNVLQNKLGWDVVLAYDKEQLLIRDLLWADLPDSYDDNAISTYRQQIYEYVYNTYPAA